MNDLVIANKDAVMVAFRQRCYQVIADNEMSCHGVVPHQELEMKKGVTVMVTPFGFVFPERTTCRPR